jgi:S1-C subfamily serine protease
MRAQYRATASSASAAEESERSILEEAERVPRYSQGVASAPRTSQFPAAPLPVTAVPARAPGGTAQYVNPEGYAGRHSSGDLPVTSVVGGNGSGGPALWDGTTEWSGWDTDHVSRPRPPQWGGGTGGSTGHTGQWGTTTGQWGPPPVEPSGVRKGFKFARRLIMWITLVSLAPILGIATLVVVYTHANGTTADAAAPPAAKSPGVTNVDTPSPAQTGPPPNLSDVVGTVNQSVMNIDATLGLQNARVAGTGIVLSANGLVLTNNHVIQGGTAITATSVLNDKTFTATVVGFDRSHDLAVLQLSKASGLKKISVGDSAKVKVGDSIIAIGNAGGDGGLPTSVTGTVTALDQSIVATDEDGQNQKRLSGMIQTAADIRAGDSGGPLVSRVGQFIGVNTAASVDPQEQATGGKGFSIPSNAALAIAQQIINGQASDTVHIGQTAFLGIGTKEGQGGASVSSVSNGGPAQKAGIAGGDVVKTFDGKAVDGPAAITAILDKHHPNDEVAITWTDRQGRARSGTVRLATGPAG